MQQALYLKLLYNRPVFYASNAVYYIFADQVKDETWAVPSRRYLKKSSTESRSDLNFEGRCPVVAPGGMPQNLWQ